MAIVSIQDLLNFIGISQEDIDFTDITGSIFDITSSNDVLSLTSDQGASNIDIPDATYTGAQLATALQTAMNNDATLTGGVITFAVSYDSDVRKFTLDATAGHTLALTYSTSDAASTLGFETDHSAAQKLVSDTSTDDLWAMVAEIRNAVEKWIQNYCKRNFESQSYNEYISGGSKYIHLKQYPVTAITRLSTGTINAIQIYNTNQYTTATVAVTSTGLVLTLNGTSDSTVLFSAYTTLSSVVTAVNALGNGWYASIISTDYSNYMSTELIPRYGQSCIYSTSVYLKIPDRAQSDFDIDEDIGEIKFATSEGYKNIRVDYTAGYSADNMPDDLKLAIKIIVKNIYQKRREEIFGVTNYSVSGVSVTLEESDIPKEAMKILGLYRRYLV